MPSARETSVPDARRPTASMTLPAHDMSTADVNVPSINKVASVVREMPNLSSIDWLVTPMHADWPGDDDTRHNEERAKMM